MDSSIDSSSSASSSRRSFHGHPARTGSTQSVHGHPWPHAGRIGETLRRGHSDGDALENVADSRSRNSSDSVAAAMDRETWMQLLTESTSPRQDPSQLAASRVAMMAADRRKRLVEHSEEQSRRRASSNLAFMHPPNRSRQISALDTFNQPFMGAPSSLNAANSFPQRDMDRPLPRRPSVDTLRDRKSREITLPRWQSDDEVSICPICNTAFSFWYRKHHCRKCGRVVCANCSPHRITIPRQFIVHPPDEAPQSPNAPVNVGADVVDLTGDSEADERVTRLDERPQSSDYRIDPALGGGQEVRLCNPCVPDPNPLPHLPYSISGRQPLDSFLRPERISPLGNRPTAPGLPALEESRQADLARPFSSSRSEYRHGHYPRLDGSRMSHLVLPGLTTSPSPSRRHSHAPTFVNSPVTPPGRPTMYGSAPDQSAPHRRLASLLQDRAVYPHHRQHASVGVTPSSSRHHSTSVLETPPQRSAPQPQLREEDECPICHQALPPKGLGGSEATRETHVQACIETHFSTSGPRIPHPPSVQAQGAGLAASTTTPSQVATPRPILTARRTSTASTDIPSASSQQRRRVAGMLVYHASEKDCVGEDENEAQECLICFEEFAVGDEMGRLECLCKFHRTCIRQWWDRKGPGACPVHQEGT